MIEFFLVVLFVGTMLPAGIHEEWLAAGGALRWLWISLATVGTLSALGADTAASLKEEPRGAGAFLLTNYD